MSDTLPLFRADINVNVHEEGGEQYLILSDVHGYADGPIMVQADMVVIFEACDGLTTWSAFASSQSLALDSAEILRARSFIGQLSTMGYFDDHHYAQRRASVDAAWHELEVRPMVCAGSTYPQEENACRELAGELLLKETLRRPEGDPAGKAELPEGSPERSPVGSHEVFEGSHEVFLIPHIDFRVAPSVYGPAFARIGEAEADLFVIIGTSHYWAEHRVILTRKHFDTPLGVVTVDRDLVDALEQRLRTFDDPDASLLAPNDLAHRPEHSIELHTVLLKHVRRDRPFTILPILVTGVGGGHDRDGVHVLERVAACLRDVVRESGRKTVWMISGDLSHVGMRFGDEVPARDMLENVKRTDGELLEHLVRADVLSYHEALEREEQRYRVCGHAPTLVGLFAAKPSSGKVLAYEVWDDADTHSAVTFATMAFSR